MKYFEDAGATSRSWLVRIGDSSVTDGSGLTGLVYNAGGLAAYYVRPGALPVEIALATLADGTAAWSSGGFVELDAAHMPGWYRFDPPNAVLAAGVKEAGIELFGAADMRPCSIEVQLGPVGANLLQIIGTTLAETVAGYLAAGFKKLLDVAAPVLTLASVNQTGDSFARIGAAGGGLTALGDARVANLDAAITSRLADADYTAPDNADIAAIKAKTDALPASPANETTVAAVKAQTDKLTFDGSNRIAGNIKAVNDTTLDGSGASGDTWGPAA